MDSDLNSNHDNASASDDSDMLAELIRTAGRRETPPSEAYDEALAAATLAWQGKVRARRQRVFVGRLAAGLAVASLSVLLWTNLSLTPDVRMAQVDRIIGSVESRNGPDGDWTQVTEDEPALLADSRLRTLPGSLLGLRMANGASLRVAGSTEFSLDEPGRITLLRGKIYVDSGPVSDPARQTRVVTAAGTAWDIGTQFEVQYMSEAYRLRVREGHVNVLRDSAEIANEAGAQLEIDSAGRLEHSRISPADPEWNWVQSVAAAPEIDNKQVSVLLEWIRRETGRPIRYENLAVEHKAATTVLHGNIRDLLPMDALDVMLATTDLEYEIQEDGAILIRARGT
jgi:ferric-dicitrate binding protein FerR (iron transport regulator)